MSPSDEVRGRTNDPTCAGHVSVSARGGFDPPLDSTDALRTVVEDPVSDARPQDTNDDLCLRGRKALDRLHYSQFVTNLTGPSDLRLEPVKVMHDPLNHLRTTIFTGPPKSEPSQAIEGARRSCSRTSVLAAGVWASSASNSTSGSGSTKGAVEVAEHERVKYSTQARAGANGWSNLMIYFSC